MVYPKSTFGTRLPFRHNIDVSAQCTVKSALGHKHLRGDRLSICFATLLILPFHIDSFSQHFTMSESHQLLESFEEERSSDDGGCDKDAEFGRDRARQQPPFLHSRMTKKAKSITTWVRTLLPAALALGLLLGFMGGAYKLGTKHSYRPLPEPVNLGGCGATHLEARQKGCVFDFILGAWMRPQCLDEGIYDEYIHKWKTLNITLYKDGETEEETDLEYAMKGDYEFIWGVGNFHHLHCSYALEKNWKLLSHEIHAVPDNVLTDEHMTHCLGINGMPSVKDILNKTRQQIFERPPIVDCLVFH